MAETVEIKVVAADLPEVKRLSRRFMDLYFAARKVVNSAIPERGQFYTPVGNRALDDLRRILDE